MLSLLVSAQQVRANTIIDEPVEAATARGQTELGQTFIAPSNDIFLTTFEFYKTALGQGTQGTFDIAPWSPSGPGPVIFSETFSSAPGYHPLIVNTSYLEVISGETYAAFIVPSTPSAVNTFLHFDGASGADYTGGKLVYYQAGLGWINDATSDAAFQAVFVPEPGASAVILLICASALPRRRTGEKQRG